MTFRKQWLLEANVRFKGYCLYVKTINKFYRQGRVLVWVRGTVDVCVRH